MASDMGTDRVKVVVYFVCAFTAALMFVGLMTDVVNNSEPDSLNAIAYPSSRLGAQRANRLVQQQLSKAVSGIGSSPWERLAISAINANTGCRDVSMQAVQVGDDQLKKEVSSLDDGSKEDMDEMVKAVEFKAQDMAGVTAPMGFFDPLGFSTNTPEGKMLFYREVELKHGRVCMLATLGFLVGEQIHPLFEWWWGGNVDVPSYVAFQETPLQKFWPAVVAAIAIPEIFNLRTFNSPFGMNPLSTWWTVDSNHKSGDLDFDPLGLKPADPQEFREMQNKELNNGRLAMIAAAGMIAQELATGEKIFNF
jgi:hypothetical protein